jgi:hypothetical protein
VSSALHITCTRLMDSTGRFVHATSWFMHAAAGFMNAAPWLMSAATQGRFQIPDIQLQVLMSFVYSSKRLFGSVGTTFGLLFSRHL